MMSCAAPEVANVTTSAVSTSGEFLFEGPNTLQGPSTLKIAEIAATAGTKSDKIKAVYLSGATLEFSPDSLQGSIESILLQWVSDDLPLVSVATKSPIPASGPVTLEVNANQDILPYLNDVTSSVVIDVNLGGDADQLDASVTFDLNINY